MMMKIAGGPGLVSPLDYGERKKPLPRTTLIAIGVVVLAHVGVGAALYYQRFELEQAEPLPEPPTVVVTMQRPVIPPEPEQPVVQRNPAQNTVIHQTPLPQVPTDTLTAEVFPDAQPNTGTVIALTNPMPTVDVPGTATEPPRSPPVITRPRWASQPSAEQMSRAFPERALQDGTSGSASMICSVSAAGGLSNCSVTAETPSNRRFGSAALGLTRYFRMQPGAVDGQAIDGARVSFSVRFAAPD